MTTCCLFRRWPLHALRTKQSPGVKKKGDDKNREGTLMRFFDSSRFVLHSALLPTILLPEKRPFSLVLAIIANL